MVETKARGALSCEVYLKSWALGERCPGSYVMNHIDNCWFCRDIIYGGTEEFPLSIEEEARRNLRREDRRNFLRYAAATLGGLTLAGMGVGSFWLGAPPDNADKARERTFGRLDKTLVLGGPPAIVRKVRNGSPEEIKSVLWWIVDRRHSQFYGLLVDALGHASVDVKTTAISQAYSVPPIDLRPHATRIDSIAAAESNQAFATALQELLHRINDS